MKHKLSVYTTTIKSAGARISVGECLCGWRNECTYVHEVKASYRKHKADLAKAKKWRERVYDT